MSNLQKLTITAIAVPTIALALSVGALVGAWISGGLKINLDNESQVIITATPTERPEIDACVRNYSGLFRGSFDVDAAERCRYESITRPFNKALETAIAEGHIVQKRVGSDCYDGPERIGCYKLVKETQLR